MELFLHHHFYERGWAIDWEPSLPGTSHVPEFRATLGASTVLVEARISGAEKAVSEQWAVNIPLMNLLESLNLPDVLTFSFDGPPPPLNRLTEVWEEVAPVVRARSEERPDGDNGDAVYYHALSLAGSVYTFQFSLFGDRDPNQARGLVMPSTGALNLQSGVKLWEDLEKKAARYGHPREPLVIAVWGAYHGRQRTELEALYGSPRWLIHARSDSTVVAAEQRLHDGILTSKGPSGPRFPQVSAVVCYRSGSTAGTVDDWLVVYHNQHATHPLPESAFDNYPRYRGDTGVWVPQDPDA